MNYYSLTIEYDGHRYAGWQIQNNAITVQEVLNKAVEKVFKSDRISSVAAGRTDAGVHALNQIVKISVPFKIESKSLVKALNTFLPNDIRVLGCKESQESFTPTSDAITRSYRYLFSNSLENRAFAYHYMANYPYDLNIDLMQDASNLFLGTHDFEHFQCSGSQVSTTVRTITSCSLRRGDQNFYQLFPEHYVFEITGSGFLKQMVRVIMGSLWLVGRGKMDPTDLERALGGSALPQKYVAPACGLYKVAVEYN